MTQTEVLQVGLTAEDIAEIRAYALDDPFYFARVICGHKELTETLHKPLLYVAAGLIDKVIGLLSDDEFCSRSFTARAIAKELDRHGCDWKTPVGRERMRDLFRIVNIRVARGYGKSSSMTHALRLWKMTRDPNLTSCIISNTEPKAIDFCKQIRATILSPMYGIVFPDRVPADIKSLLRENAITLAGRTVPDKEPSLMAFGHKASPVGYHYDEIQTDDLVARENRSPLELAEVRDFLANMFGLYNPGIRFPIARLHVGTRWDEEDDDALVRMIPNCFTVNVPAWYREEASDDILAPGLPTDPSWKGLDAILELQKEVLSDPQQGSIAWRCNYELDPAIGGGRIFPAALVDSADWIPLDSKTLKNIIEWDAKDLMNSRVLLSRVKRDDKNKPIQKKNEDGTPRTVNGEKVYQFAAFDPMKLYRVTALDQSFSESGDEWAVGTVGMDQYNYRYVLEVTTGHGIAEMFDAFFRHVTEWRPNRVGQEKIQAAELIEMLMKTDDRYRRLYSRIEPIPHGSIQKPYRIRNGVAEVLKMNRLYLNPRDFETKNEMKRYKPTPNAKDNRLDVLAMCEWLIKRSMEPREGEQNYKDRFKNINSANQKRRDPRTGVQLW